MKPKLVLSGSMSQQDAISHWRQHFTNNGYDIIAYPNGEDDTSNFNEHLTKVYSDYYKAIEECDVFFLANEDRKGIKGYIGANCTAELLYAVVQNLIHGKSIKIYIFKIPSKDVFAHDEVMNFLKNGWIELYNPSI